MSDVAIVTDSTAYLPAELIERHGVHVVPLYVVFEGDRPVPEVEITDYDEFFEELRSAERLPTTSQPSVGDFTSAYEPLLEEGREVVSIHISGGLSGTPEAARQAKEALERDGRGGERITVVDSHTTAGGLGFMVLAAAKAVREGADAAATAAHVAEARSEFKLWFAIDTLEFLKRGGRIGAASAWIGSTLKVKPILTVEGEMTPVERVRTSSRAFERMVDYARQRKDSGAGAWSAQHIAAPDQCAALVERCTEVFGHGPTIVSELALPALPAAQAHHLAAHLDLPGRRTVGAGELARDEDEARARHHHRLPRPARGAAGAHRADRAAAHHRGQRLRRQRAPVRPRRDRVREGERPPARAEPRLRHHEPPRGGGRQAARAPAPLPRPHGPGRGRLCGRRAYDRADRRHRHLPGAVDPGRAVQRAAGRDRRPILAHPADRRHDRGGADRRGHAVRELPHGHHRVGDLGDCVPAVREPRDPAPDPEADGARAPVHHDRRGAVRGHAARCARRAGGDPGSRVDPDPGARVGRHEDVDDQAGTA